MVEDNEEFNKVYSKLINVINAKINNIYQLRIIGYSIDYTTIKLLNLYMNYLRRVKDSKYKYCSICNLNIIYDFLNKL